MTTPNPTRRKLASASCSAPKEGVIYGQMGIDMTAALAHIETLRAESGLKISITHLVGKAVALGLSEAPGLNGRIHLGKFGIDARIERGISENEANLLSNNNINIGKIDNRSTQASLGISLAF